MHRLAAVGLSMTMAGLVPLTVVLADNVYNDLDASIDSNLEVMNLTVGGANGTVSFKMEPASGDGKNGCNFQGNEFLNVSLTVNSAIATVTPSSFTFNNCNDSKVVTVHPTAVGSTTVTVVGGTNTTGDTFVFNTGDFTVNVSAPPANGHIVVDKITDPSADSQVFSFDGVGGSYADFTLTDIQTPNDQGLVAGTYSVSEGVVGGWDQTSATCQSSLGNSETIGNISLQSGEIVTCTFTNTKRGTIVVDKVTVLSGDAQSFTFTPSYGSSFGLTDAATPNTSAALVPGVYSVSEAVPSDWDLTNVTCSDGSLPSAINLGAGETVTCVFTNTKRSHIVVQKVTDPEGDPGVFSFDAVGGTYGDFTLSGGNSNDQTLVAGTYSVLEEAVAGWDPTSAVCVSSNDDTEAIDNISLQTGETVTCTFTNTKLGTIIVEKQTAPDGADGTFTFTGDATGSIADGETIVVSDLMPGTYTSTEADPTPAFDLTDITCDDDNSNGDIGTGTATFTLEAGETVRCIFANTKRGSLEVTKVTLGGDGEFDFTGDGFDPFSITTVLNTGSYEISNLPAGEYMVDEDDEAGWDETSNDCVDVDVLPGQKATCIVTNTEKGHIVIQKVTVPALDPAEFSFDAYYGDDFALNDGESNDQEVSAGGDYAVTEASYSEWDVTSDCDDDNSTLGDINVEPGETVICTVTNTKRGHIVVDKVTNPVGDLQTFDFISTYGDPFGLSDADTPDDSGPLVPGTYEVSEAGMAGWDLTSIVCSDGSVPNAIEVDPGETVTCTFTNTKRGTIIVEKQTDPDLDPTLFAFAGDAAGSIADGGSITVNNIVPGAHAVTETVPAGWELKTIVCTDLDSVGNVSTKTATYNVQPGETVRCVFANKKLPVTRGQGFWATHNTYSVGFLPPSMTIGSPVKKTILTSNQLMGAFWSSIPYKSNLKSKRDKADQSRMQLLQQLVATKMNCRAFGCDASIDALVTSADAAYSGTNTTLMLSLAGQLGTYNGLGESSPIVGPQPGNATPTAAQTMANKVFWDNPNL